MDSYLSLHFKSGAGYFVIKVLLLQEVNCFNTFRVNAFLYRSIDIQVNLRPTPFKRFNKANYPWYGIGNTVHKRFPSKLPKDVSERRGLKVKIQISYQSYNIFNVMFFNYIFYSAPQRWKARSNVRINK